MPKKKGSVRTPEARIVALKPKPGHKGHFRQKSIARRIEIQTFVPNSKQAGDEVHRLPAMCKARSWIPRNRGRGPKGIYTRLLKVVGGQRVVLEDQSALRRQIFTIYGKFG